MRKNLETHVDVKIMMPPYFDVVDDSILRLASGQAPRYYYNHSRVYTLKYALCHRLASQRGHAWARP